MCAQEKVLRQWLEDVHRDLLWTGGGGRKEGMEKGTVLRVCGESQTYQDSVVPPH